MTTFQITGIKSHKFAAAGQIEITCQTKYIGEMVLSIPVTAFTNLLAELGQSIAANQDNRPVLDAAVVEPSEPAARPAPRAQQAAPAKPAASGAAPAGVEYKVQIPRKVIVTADVKQHALVLM